jgi:hypothetical protein
VPDEFDAYVRRPAAADPFSAYERSTAPEVQESDSSVGGMALGGAALLAAAVAARNPSLLGKFFRGANAVRQQAMLSGLALPKSILGNTGAALNASMERKSLAPLKSLFSRQTFDDAVHSYKTGGSAGPTPGVNLPGPNPGKVMGALDDATQKALVRSGLSATEAQRSVLQAPLTGELGQVLESPAAKYVLPFRRTPFNQFTEGWRTFKQDFPHKGVRNAYIGAGAVHGAATSEEQYPVSIPMASALAAKYGLPYALAAVAARKLSGGQGGGGILGSTLPVSEYGVEQSLSDPFAPFVKPAASRFFE